MTYTQWYFAISIFIWLYCWLHMELENRDDPPFATMFRGVVFLALGFCWPLGVVCALWVAWRDAAWRSRR